jgi:anti-sigma B factor antagonist
MTDEVRVRVSDTQDPVVVSVHGPIFYGTHEPLLDTLAPLAEGARRRIVVDLADVRTCDSTGLNILVQAKRRATAGGGWLRLAAPQPMVRRVLEITNLLRTLPVYDSVADAVADGTPE